MRYVLPAKPPPQRRVARYRLRKAPHYSVGGVPVLFVDSSEKIERVLKMLPDADRVGVDTEFHGFRLNKEHAYGKGRPTSVQLTLRGPRVGHEGMYVFIPCWGKYEGTLRPFRRWFAEEKLQKVFHDAKEDMHVLENAGCPVRGFRADTLVKAFMVQSDGDHTLKGLAAEYFNVAPEQYGDAFRVPKLKKNGEPGKAMRVAPPNEVVSGSLDWFFGDGVRRLVEYAVKDPRYTLDLEEKLDETLAGMEWVPGKSMLDYYTWLEREYTEVLYAMERRGVMLDPARLEELLVEFEAQKVQAERDFFRTCVQMGVRPALLENMASDTKSAKGILGSTKQLGILLVEHLGIHLPVTEKGNISTSDEALQTVTGTKARRLVDSLLKYRAISDKYLGTYVHPLREIAACEAYEGSVHTSLNQTGANTGRLSSSSPNLQNIPARTEEGKKIRSAFVARYGHCLGDIDLSQIELRLIAHFSQDPVMIDAYHRGLDLHSRTAVEVFPHVREWVGKRELTPELLEELAAKYGRERGRAKNCYHPDTEVLTKTGWRRITDLAPGECVLEAIPRDGFEAQLRWVVPEIVESFEEKELHHLKNEGIDIRVTSNHRMLVWNRDGSHRVVMPDKFKNVYRWMNAGHLRSSSKEDGQLPLIRLAVATQADGSIVGLRGAIKFGFTKQRKIRRLRALLREAGVQYTTGRTHDVTWFRVAADEARGVLKLLDERKQFTWKWLRLGAHAREAAVSELRFWGSHQPKGCRVFHYTTIDRQSADVMQAVALSIGRKTRLVVVPSRSHSPSVQYRLTVRDVACTRGEHVEVTREPYCGPVVCLTVPSGFIVVRDGGVPLLCGNTNFMIAYGGGPQLYAVMNDASIQEGKRVIQQFFKAYRGIERDMQQTLRFCRQHGYVRTLLRRYVHFPDICHPDPARRGHAERAAYNAKIQGSAADMMRMAMVLCHRDERLRLMGVGLNLQVHDELLFDVPSGRTEEAARPIINELVSHPYRALGLKDLRVDTPAELKYGNNWAEAH